MLALDASVAFAMMFSISPTPSTTAARHRKRPDFLERLLAEDAEDHCDYDDPFA